MTGNTSVVRRLIFPTFSSQNMHGFGLAAILIPSFHGHAWNARDHNCHFMY